MVKTRDIALISILVLLSISTDFLSIGMGAFAFYGFVIALFGFLLGGKAVLFGIGYLGVCIIRSYPFLYSWAEMSANMVNSVKPIGLPVWFVFEVFVVQVYAVFYFEYFFMRYFVRKKRVLERLGFFGLSV